MTSSAVPAVAEKPCAVRTCRDMPIGSSARGLCQRHDGLWRVSLNNTQPQLVRPKPDPERAFLVWKATQELADVAGDEERRRKLFESL